MKTRQHLAPEEERFDAVLTPELPVRTRSTSPTRVSLPPWMGTGSPTWIWLGVAVVASGFALLGVAWGQVAGEADVYRQIPYLVSAGMVGLAVVMVGLAIVDIVERQRDAIDHRRQVDRLIAALHEVREVLDRDGEDGS